jgi:hypothetical protein
MKKEALQGSDAGLICQAFDLQYEKACPCWDARLSRLLGNTGGLSGVSTDAPTRVPLKTDNIIWHRDPDGCGLFGPGCEEVSLCQSCWYRNTRR